MSLRGESPIEEQSSRTDRDTAGPVPGSSIVGRVRQRLDAYGSAWSRRYVEMRVAARTDDGA